MGRRGVSSRADEPPRPALHNLVVGDEAAVHVAEPYVRAVRVDLAQGTLIKALIASVLPEGCRAAAFGIFYLGYGAGWLAGSVVMGLLYERSHTALIAFAVATQLASVPLFLMGARRA